MQIVGTCICRGKCGNLQSYVCECRMNLVQCGNGMRNSLCGKLNVDPMHIEVT